MCYAHDDEGVVFPEMAWLHEQTINLWYDEGISAGRIWREEIGNAIKGASKVLYYISEASLASDHCDREINFALDHHKSVLPVYLEDVALTTDLEVGLGRVQALHRTTDQDYQGHLLGALGRTVEATRPLPRAKQRVRLQLDVLVALVVVLLIGASGWWYLNAPTAQGPIRSIAVLPLENLSGDPAQEHVADGMTDALIGELGKLASLNVISRTSVMRYKQSDKLLSEIASELGVEGVLEGTVIREEDQIRVNVQLIDARTDTYIWNDRFDR